jgi:hypothetical protein
MAGTPPYDLIRDCLQSGQVIPFLGAGASLNTRPLGATWKSIDDPFLPLGRELAEDIADYVEFPSTKQHDRGDLARVASFFVEEQGDRTALLKRLKRIFGAAQTPGEIHRLLSEYAATQPMVIITTNYDSLIELALRERGVSFDLVVYPTEDPSAANAVLWRPHDADHPKAVHPNDLYIDLDSTTVVYKMHGSLDAPPRDGAVAAGSTARPLNRMDSMVVTEEDYIDFLARMTSQSAVPKIFFNKFHDRHFLFLGYSLRDWNLRVILRYLASSVSAGTAAVSTAPRRSWAIQWKPSDLDERFWLKRGVTTYDRTVEQFAQELKGA